MIRGGYFPFNLSHIVYTEYKDFEKFDEIQLLIVDVFRIMDMEYERTAGAKLRHTLERWLLQNENLDIHKILNKKRIFEEWPYTRLLNGDLQKV